MTYHALIDIVYRGDVVIGLCECGWETTLTRRSHALREHNEHAADMAPIRDIDAALRLIAGR